MVYPVVHPVFMRVLHGPPHDGPYGDPWSVLRRAPWKNLRAMGYVFCTPGRLMRHPMGQTLAWCVLWIKPW